METIKFYSKTMRCVATLRVASKAEFLSFMKAHRNEINKRLEELTTISGVCYKPDMERFIKQMSEAVMPHFYGYIVTYNTVVYILKEYAEFDWKAYEMA